VPLDFRFRLSLYLTLAAACLALACAEQPLVPEILFFAGPVLALLLVAYVVEGRWALPTWASNLLGLVIGAGWGVWLDQRFFGETEGWHDALPLSAALLPEVGPLLLIVVLAKLFRPKERRDVWVLHGLGLLQVALACVLGFTPAFGALLFVYVVCALWSLALFNLRGGTEGAGRPLPAGRPSAPAPVRPLRWTLAVTAFALAVCLLLPRGGEAWNPLRLVASASHSGPVAGQTGGSDQVDLNRTGWVEVNDEVAFVVAAEDAEGKPKLDLSPMQRWRGVVLDQYRHGRWGNGWALPLGALPVDMGPGMGNMLPPFPPEEDPGPQPPFVDLGPGQYFLTFDIDLEKAGGLYLSDPVIVRGARARVGETAVTSLRPMRSLNPLFTEFEGTLVPGHRPNRGVARYRQVTLPPEEPDLGPSVLVHREYANYLCQQPVPALTSWTRQLVQGLASRSESGLTAADPEWEPASDRLQAEHPDGVLPQAHWEKVAGALTAYLAHAPEYSYSLELRRQDWTADPTLDFLCNVKAGHCQRYAGGLALMLRSLGIPARLVLGFRGAEPRNDGTYAVHNGQAHAWVETLVPRAGPAGQTRWHWLALDPTPAGEPSPPPWFTVSRWWDKGRDAGEVFWKFLVVDYNADQQDQLWSSLARSLQSPSGWLRSDARWLVGLGLLPLGLAAWWLGRRLLRRVRARPASTVAFFRRLLAILERRRGLLPAPSQTPREFAEVARQALAAIPPELAGLPGEVAELLYRVRYGAVPLTDAERQDVDRRLIQLDAALAGR
jgi:transglutaminase-like putative cysteine protease